MTIIMKNKQHLSLMTLNFSVALGKRIIKNKIEGDKKTPKGIFL